MTKQYVYWIHTTNMTDPTVDGYIGVTNNIKRRIANHFSRLRNECHDNQRFQRAYLIDDGLIVDIIYEGLEADCYNKELELRPHRNVGWNINEGGSRPPKQLGNQNAKGNKGPIKQVVSPDGLIFESRKLAATHYGVDITTIHNWLKDPSKPWIKGLSSKPLNKYDIRSEGLKRQRPILTPRGEFESVKAASLAYEVVHGTINYWLKTRPDQFYYLIKSDVSA